jgi:hypothetical protein
MKTSPSKPMSENIEKLHALCDQLTSRDDQLKNDFRMFEDFFSNFPIPVTMWFIGKDHAIISKWGNAFTCNHPKNLEEMFECPELRDESIRRHEQAFGNELVSYFVQHEKKLFWCKLIPRKSTGDEITGILGMAWDITSNSMMLHSIENAIELLENEGSLTDIKDALQKALGASRLKKMLDEKEQLRD